MATRAASPDRVFAIFFYVSRCHAICIFLNRGGLPYERVGDVRRKFWIKPVKETNLGVGQPLLTPKRDKFQHSWLNKDRCHFVLKLRCGGLFMLKTRVCFACCAKDVTCLILKTSWKFLTRSPVNDFAKKSHCRTSQHMNAVSAEMLQRVSVFQRTLDEREIVTEDVLMKVFTAAYWIMKKTYLTTRSSHL